MVSKCINIECNEFGKWLSGCAEGYTGSKCDTDATLHIRVGLFVGILLVGVIVSVIATLVVLLLIRRFKRKKGKEASSSGINTNTPKSDQRGPKYNYEDLDDATREQQQNHEYDMPQTSIEEVERRSSKDVQTVDYENAHC
ncbi:uncharacterized protein LOC128204830 [Mya arenaria]|uniref:uncharacterized protein LOC128204830 n=1 Tax=Mya arenaria TaxID=6604 RepID=UPI0022E4971A|nr:uncharacterized protein LOC128204830 [Mya arenaria]